MEQTDFDVLESLALRDKWDIETLWNRVTIETLERFDAAGWIQLRRVGLRHVPPSTPTVDPKPWHSPIESGESWATYFPNENREGLPRQSLKPLREHFTTPLIGGMHAVLVYDLNTSAPVEVRVSEVGRRALIACRTETVAGGDSGELKPTALPTVSDESSSVTLTENQRRVLQTMVLFDGARLLSAQMIEVEMEPYERLAIETVRKCVKKLIESGLAERPEGRALGARLTNQGRKLAGKVAD